MREDQKGCLLKTVANRSFADTLPSFFIRSNILFGSINLTGPTYKVRLGQGILRTETSKAVSQLIGLWGTKTSVAPFRSER